MPAISSAIFSAVGRRSSCGTTCATKPAFSASSALMFLPVKISAMALDLPTARMSLCVPPAPGMMPSLISGWPKTAFSLAMMMSHIMATSQPPPKAKPFTAAMTGSWHSETHCQALNLSEEVMSAKLRGAISLMSAPAANARPAPVRTMQPVLGSPSAAARAAPRSAMSSSQRALREAVLTSVSNTTRPLRSTRTLEVSEMRLKSAPAGEATPQGVKCEVKMRVRSAADIARGAIVPKGA
mmetsp:Transcript_104759/g.312958  ORF Transcript_104759/g.312958 Transcript_104759/m.312958 type:complete len:240 (-) Transcript_104759:16-735(-)